MWQQTRQQFSEWLRGLLRGGSLDSPDGPTSFLPEWLVLLLNYLLPMLIVGVGSWLLSRYVLQGLNQLSRYRFPLSSSAPEPPPTITAWEQQAFHFQSQGNYREACRCLYLALLQHLHDTQVLPHHLSRTDGEHRDQITRLTLGAPLSPHQLPHCLLLINTHEHLCFDPASQISADQFEQCQQALHSVVTTSVPS